MCVCVCVCIYVYIYIYISAVKQFIVINRIQNKGFCLHNICVCTVYIYYVYINIQTNVARNIFWYKKFETKYIFYFKNIFH